MKRLSTASAVLFLQGKASVVVAQLKAQMEGASTALAFERAARYRDQITRLTQLQANGKIHLLVSICSLHEVGLLNERYGMPT